MSEYQSAPLLKNQIIICPYAFNKGPVPFPLIMQVPELRKKSRVRYLGERVKEKLAELEADIIDNEYLFAETKYVITI